MDLMKAVRDPDKMKAGEWISLGAAFGNVEVKCRAAINAYSDDLTERRRALARQFGGGDRIPAAEDEKSIIEALIATVVLDVRAPAGVTIGGKPVNREAFVELMRHGGAQDLVSAVLLAYNRVGRQYADDTKDAVGN